MSIFYWFAGIKIRRERDYSNYASSKTIFIFERAAFERSEELMGMAKQE